MAKGPALEFEPPLKQPKAVAAGGGGAGGGAGAGAGVGVGTGAGARGGAVPMRNVTSGSS